MRFLIATLIILNGFVADGYIQSADAQCGPKVKIYIDPRLFPHQDMASGQQSIASILASPSIPENVKNAFLERRLEELRLANTPIVMPYTGGRVLVNRQNPCIQQFIPN